MLSQQGRLDQRAVREAIFEAFSPQAEQEAFHLRQGSPDNYVTLSYAVNRILRQRGFGDQEGVRNQDEATLVGRADQLLREVVWELITQGILVPGYDYSRPDWPCVSLTEYGREVIEEGRLTPADPDRYLDRLRAVYPELDDDTTLYVAEALSAFNRRLYLAAVVMLGVAAEGLMYELADAIRSSFQHSEEGENWHRKKIANRPALQQHNAIMDSLQSVQEDMHRHTRELLDTHLRGIYSLIRQHRNEAGHPTGTQKSRDEVLPLFYLFVIQAGLISVLCRWLREANRF